MSEEEQIKVVENVDNIVFTFYGGYKLFELELCIYNKNEVKLDTIYAKFLQRLYFPQISMN